MRTLLKTLSTTAAALIVCAAPAFSAAPPDLTVMEFFHVPTGHYFMTGSSDDQRVLTSAPANQAFLPTGRSFSAWSDSNKSRPVNAVAVQRFFNPATASHVFTSSAADIRLLRTLPVSSNGSGFSDEGVAFFALTATAGRCESGTLPVFRAFNNRPDGNHRYSNELELQAATVNTGFADEAVAFCTTGVSSDASVEKRAGTPRPSGEDASISGAVNAYVSLASFKIGAQPVDASQARFEGGTAAALTNGVQASAEGVILNGVLRATEMKLALGNSTTAPVLADELHGFVTALGTGGTLFVNGSAVDISHATITGGTAAQLIVGAEVEVHGGFVSGVFVATLVQIDDTPRTTSPTMATACADIDSTISQFTSVSNFVVSNQRVDASNAVFEGGTAAALAVGLRVDVRGSVVSGALIATRVEIKRARADASSTGTGTGTSGNNTGSSNTGATAFEASGAITAFTSLSSFTVAGVTVDASAATFKDGTAADLRVGTSIEVKGTLSNAVVKATTIEIIATTSTTPPTTGNGTPDGTEFEVKDVISAFTSVSSFVIAKATVDASGATFEKGTAANLRQGVTVEVKGVWRAGKVIASRVRFQ